MGDKQWSPKLPWCSDNCPAVDGQRPYTFDYHGKSVTVTESRCRILDEWRSGPCHIRRDDIPALRQKWQHDEAAMSVLVELGRIEACRLEREAAVLLTKARDMRGE